MGIVRINDWLQYCEDTYENFLNHPHGQVESNQNSANFAQANLKIKIASVF